MSGKNFFAAGLCVTLFASFILSRWFATLTYLSLHTAIDKTAKWKINYGDDHAEQQAIDTWWLTKVLLENDSS